MTVANRSEAIGVGLGCPTTFSTLGTATISSETNLASNSTALKPHGMRPRLGCRALRRELAVEVRDGAERQLLRASLWFEVAVLGD